MNLDHLDLFLRIARHRNISLAGRELGLSAAAASAQLNKLEATIGARLVHRTTRSVSLTEDGEVFLSYAEDMLSSLDSARAAMGVGNASPKGRLRVAAPASFGRMHLLPALAEFLALYPDLQVDCRLSDTIVDLVEGGFDIAIRNAALPDSSMIARKLAPDQRLLCASPAYLAQHGEPQHPQDLAQHDCITLIGLEDWLFESPDGPVSVQARGRFRTDNGEAIRDACLNGMGITINSSWSAYESLRRGELVEVLKDFPLASDTAIWAIYPSSRQLAAKVRVFIDFFADRFAGQPYWDSSLANSDRVGDNSKAPRP
jgi:DNA-binding transcriptional LysR family regulator